MQKYRLTKLAASDDSPVELATESDRQERGWGDKSPPIQTVVTGTGVEPCVGCPFILIGIKINGISEHGNSYVTSTVKEAERDGDKWLFSTSNSKYVLEPIS